MKDLLYPIVFKPIYKERIWGGSLIAELFNEKQLLNNKKIGEAWLISDRENDCTTVENGKLKGLTLKQLKDNFKEHLLGTNFNYTKPFPLLVKILHAEDDLSVQVHPKEIDTLTLQNAETKNEFWYILKSHNANIIAGLKNNIQRSKLIDNLAHNKITTNNIVNYFNIYSTKENEIYYIKSGLVHAINKNNLILEIQQNSDTTYRLYDYNRLDDLQKPRDLHLNEANICMLNAPKKPIIKQPTENLYSSLFKVNRYNITSPIKIKTTLKSFKLISVISGSIEIKTHDNKNSLILNQYQTALLPANLTFIVINKSLNAKFIITKTK